MSPGSGTSPKARLSTAFVSLPGRFKKNAASGLNAIYLFDLFGDGGGNWYIIIKNGSCRVGEGEAFPASNFSASIIAISMTAQDCLGMLAGKLDPQVLFTTGRLRITGDVDLLSWLNRVFSVAAVVPTAAPPIAKVPTAPVPVVPETTLPLPVKVRLVAGAGLVASLLLMAVVVFVLVFNVAFDLSLIYKGVFVTSLGSPLLGIMFLAGLLILARWQLRMFRKYFVPTLKQSISLIRTAWPILRKGT